MSVLDQIEEIIEKKIENGNGDLITSLVIDNGPYGYCYNIWFRKGYLKFETKTEMIKHLNSKGWKINTISKS